MADDKRQTFLRAVLLDNPRGAAKRPRILDLCELSRQSPWFPVIALVLSNGVSFLGLAMTITLEQLAVELKRFIAPSYPEMEIRAVAWDQDPQRTAIYFTERKFALLYPYQRWHYLSHLIPEAYQKANLQNTVWFELAPGEKPEDLQYPDEELIDSITPEVMKCVVGCRFFEVLDDAMCPIIAGQERAQCWGDYRNSRPILLSRGFKEDELFDVFHVLMRKGGFCDCEILYNAVERSRLKAEYWIARSEGRNPYDPHRGA